MADMEWDGRPPLDDEEREHLQDLLEPAGLPLAPAGPGPGPEPLDKWIQMVLTGPVNLNADGTAMGNAPKNGPLKERLALMPRLLLASLRVPRVPIEDRTEQLGDQQAFDAQLEQLLSSGGAVDHAAFYASTASLPGMNTNGRSSMVPIQLGRLYVGAPHLPLSLLK